MRDDTPEIRKLQDAVRELDCSGPYPVYAVQHRDGRLVRTSAGQIKRFSSPEGAQSYIANLRASGYKVVRYS